MKDSDKITKLEVDNLFLRKESVLGEIHHINMQIAKSICQIDDSALAIGSDDNASEILSQSKKIKVYLRDLREATTELTETSVKILQDEIYKHYK